LEKVQKDCFSIFRKLLNNSRDLKEIKQISFFLRKKKERKEKKPFGEIEMKV